jgi:hypothetical protein
MRVNSICQEKKLGSHPINILGMQKLQNKIRSTKKVSQKARMEGPLGDLITNERIILKWILQK